MWTLYDSVNWLCNCKIGWLKSLLPKSALVVEEMAWNAYPYTRTRYTCPFIDKFSLDIETVYKTDPGEIENVFNLKKSELNERAVGQLSFFTPPFTLQIIFAKKRTNFHFRFNWCGERSAGDSCRLHPRGRSLHLCQPPHRSRSSRRELAPRILERMQSNLAIQNELCYNNDHSLRID